MSINGRGAVSLLDSMEKRVVRHRQDNTDKLWSYKLCSRPGTEFAFDPDTTTGLFVWVATEHRMAWRECETWNA